MKCIKSFFLLFLWYQFVGAKGIYDIKYAATPAKCYEQQIKLDQNNDTLSGLVDLTNGLFVTTTGYWDNPAPLSGELKIRHANSLELRSDLILTSSAWLTIGSAVYDIAFIYGNGGSIVLNGPLTIPANRTLHISSDTIINGQDNQLLVDANAQIFVDDNVTLTLRNLVLKDRQHVITMPPVRLASHRSKLALDNVVLAPGRDFLFPQGQFFVHNDVQFTGTSAFIYQSPLPSWITSGGCLYFDHGTTFSIAPATFTDAPYTLKNTYTDCHFIKMADKSSQLYLNGCSLMTTYTGNRFIRGSVSIDNKVTFDSSANVQIASYNTQVGSSVYSGSQIEIIEWSPNGRFIAVVSTSTSIKIYRFDGTTTPVDIYTIPIAASTNRVASWSPDGKFIAIGCRLGSNNLRIYRFDGISTFTSVAEYTISEQVQAFAWSPDGRFFAVGNNTESTSLSVYKFDGLSATMVGSPIGAGQVGLTVDWSPDGRFIAVGNWASESTFNFSIYQFDGVSSPTRVGATVVVGTATNNIYSVKWSPDSRFVAVANNTSSTMYIYRFNGTSTPSLTTSVGVEAGARSVHWSPDGQFIAVGTTGSLRVYKFNGSSTPTLVGSAVNLSTQSARWSPDGKFIAMGRYTTSSNLNIYRAIYGNETTPQALSKSIVFGDSAKGAAHDADVNILNGAEIKLMGSMYYDCVS
jgi:WD40 repeat protein